jgi:hypothetical protein
MHTLFIGEEKANLVDHCLNMLQEIGVIVAGVTCDGPSSNFAMLSSLGASILPGMTSHQVINVTLRLCCVI